MASKSKNRRRVFRASCILAALIVAGSSFAWFTSKDEVTNRLSAKADYDVAIAEDFTPPENWIPGQQINKDVGVVNTGNVDAFARVWLTGEMRVLQTTDAGATPIALDDWSSSTGGFLNTTTALFENNTDNDVEDSELVKMGLTKFTTDGTNEEPRYYFKSLSTTSTKNPEDNQQTNKQDDYNNENDTDYYSEVQAMQAGGVLAYAPNDAEYTYVLNQETELPIYSTDGTTAKVVTRKVPAGTRVYVTTTAIGSANSNWLVSTTADMSTITTVWVPAQSFTATNIRDADHFNPVNIDADSFQPLTPGLYLFNRNVDLDATATNPNDYEFSGYYYSDYDTVITDGNGTTTMGHTQHNGKVPTTVTTTQSAWVDNNGKITPVTDGEGYGKGTYYALKNENDLKGGNNRSDYTVPNGAVTVKELDNDLYYIAPTSSLELYTAAYSKIDADTLKWRVGSTGAETSGTDIIYAIYDKDGTDGTFNKDDDIVVEIGIKNLGTSGQTWTPLNSATNANATGYTLNGSAETTDASKLTFYYNDDIESGDTTARLVDYVKLSELVTNKAYLAFDFDLNVNMESVQVTYDEDGNELTKPVEASGVWDNATNTAVTGAKATQQNSGEISDIVWTKYSST